MTATTTPNTDSESDDSDSTDSVTTTFEVGHHTITYGPTPLDGVDETAVRFHHSLQFLSAVLESVAGAEVDLTDQDVEAKRRGLRRLEEAFQAGMRVLDSHAYEAFLQDGPEALPEDVLEALRDDLAPAAALFGTELAIPGYNGRQNTGRLAGFLADRINWGAA
jgi:hypothetical protein